MFSLYIKSPISAWIAWPLVWACHGSTCLVAACLPCLPCLPCLTVCLQVYGNGGASHRRTVRGCGSFIQKDLCAHVLYAITVHNHVGIEMSRLCVEAHAYLFEYLVLTIEEGSMELMFMLNHRWQHRIKTLYYTTHGFKAKSQLFHFIIPIVKFLVSS